jgi:hypothetical protein
MGMDTTTGAGANQDQTLVSLMAQKLAKQCYEFKTVAALNSLNRTFKSRGKKRLSRSSLESLRRMLAIFMLVHQANGRPTDCLQRCLDRIDTELAQTNIEGP